MLILPDTSCWVEFFRPHGNETVREQLLSWLAVDRLALCGPVRAEVLRGVRKAEAPRIERAFAALPYIETIDGDWEAVAKMAGGLAGRGQTVPLLDMLIAAVAHRSDAVLAHRDARFQQIQSVLSLRIRDFLAEGS